MICSYCKVKKSIQDCVCGKTSYCGDECSKRDWIENKHNLLCKQPLGDIEFFETYDIFANDNTSGGHEPDLSIYPPVPKKEEGLIRVKSNFGGYILDKENNLFYTNLFKIAFTRLIPDNIKEKPYILYLHGVPTNRKQSLPMLSRIARFLPVITFDMLGMGDSDKPRFYGSLEGEKGKEYKEAWKWHNDIPYISQIINALIPAESSFIFVCDDWGGGQCVHLSSTYNELYPDQAKLIGQVLIDPIAFDGYPVPEIQAIGRAAEIEDDMDFAKAMGAFDQTLVQIYKTMVHNPHKVYNQYSLRDIMSPYLDSNYVKTKDGEISTSLTMKLDFHAIRVLAERASILSSALLLPYHPIKNAFGVRYDKISFPSLVLWGEYDNMMPETQRYRFQMLCGGPVDHRKIPRAGHFATTDQPDDVAEGILSWIKSRFGKDTFEPFFGFTGIWKGDEHIIYNMLKK